MIDPVKAFETILRYVTPEAMRRGDIGVLISAVREELQAPKAGTTSTAALEDENLVLRSRVTALEMMLEANEEITQMIEKSETTPRHPAPKKGRKGKTSDNN